MGAARKIVDKKVFRELVPLNALSPVHLDEIYNKAAIEDVRSGRYLFREEETDNNSVFLLDGKIELVNSKREIIDTIVAGSDAARHPLAHKQPRQISARAAGNVTVARIDSSLLDVLLTWDESAGYDVVEIDAEEDDDWMTRMLQSQAFLQLPPSNIHQLLMRLEAVTAKAGDVIVNQGEEGEYFYIVKSGRLAVTRKASSRSKEVLLAELGEGACFGEEALVSGTRRNASVMMVTDGTLMRLSKNDFDELLRVPLVRDVNFRRAEEMVSAGAVWLDMRLPGEFENRSVAGSSNLPLSALRDRINELDPEQTYILCCDTGRRSSAGAFVLGQRGYDVHYLANGLMEVPDEALTPGAASGKEAEVIPFNAEDELEAFTTESSPGTQPDDDNQDRRQIEVLETRVAELQAALAQREEELSRHQADREGSAGEASAVPVETRDQLEQLQSSSQAEIGDLTRRLEEKEAELRGSLDKAAELEKKVADQVVLADSLQQELELGKSSRDELDGELGEMRQAVERLEKDNAELQARVEVSDLALQEHKDAVSSIQQQLDDALRDKGGADERTSELEKTIDSLRQEHKSEIDSVHGAMARVQNERENILKAQERLQKDLEKARRQLTNEQNDHQDSVHRLRKELEAAAAKDNNALSGEIREMREQHRAEQEQNRELQQQLASLGEELASLQQEHDSVRAQLVSAEESRRQLEESGETRLMGEQQVQQTLREEIANLMTQRDETQEKLTVMEQELVELRAAAAHMPDHEKTVADLQKALEELEQSGRQHSQEYEEKLAAQQKSLDEAQESERQAREEADRYRGEAEVARGLADASNQTSKVEEELRDALEQARKDVDVAVRLRNQAEDELADVRRDAEELRNELRRYQDGDINEVQTTTIPLLDDDTDVSAYQEVAAAAEPAEPVAPVRLMDDEVRPNIALLGTENTRAGGGLWKGMVVGFLMILSVLAGGAYWWIERSGGVLVLDLSALLPQSAGQESADDPDSVDSQGQQGAQEPPNVAMVDSSESLPGDAEDSSPPDEGNPSSAPEAKEADTETAPEAVIKPFSMSKGMAVELPPRISEPVVEDTDITSVETVEPLTETVVPDVVAVKQPAGRFADVLSDGATAPRMVSLHEARFVMGSGSSSPNFDERPERVVTLDSYAISEREISFDDYDRFARSTGRRLPGDEGWGRGKRPVINVSHRDAIAYTRWLSEQTGKNYRLPTEAEWEYAARGGSSRRFAWGGDVSDGMANCYNCAASSSAGTRPGGSYPANDYGLYDMAGNAREWVQDCYRSGYKDAPVDGRAVSGDGACAAYVVRGGGYHSPGDKLRSASRDKAAAGSRLDDLGFRVVRQ